MVTRYFLQPVRHQQVTLLRIVKDKEYRQRLVKSHMLVAEMFQQIVNTADVYKIIRMPGRLQVVEIGNANVFPEFHNKH